MPLCEGPAVCRIVRHIGFFREIAPMRDARVRVYSEEGPGAGPIPPLPLFLRQDFGRMPQIKKL